MLTFINVDDADFYDLLGLESNASELEIKKSYKNLAKRWHPDKNRDNVELATRKMQLLEKAKETLMDKVKRKAYDDKTRAQSV